MNNLIKYLILLIVHTINIPLLSLDRLQVEELKYVGPLAEKWIVSGIRGTLTNDLRRLASNYEVLTVDDQNTALKMAMERRKAGEKINIAEETARILKIDYRCVGEVQNVGKDVRVTLKLLKAPDFEIYKSSTTDKKRTELLELQNLLAQNLLQDVDEKITTETQEVIKSSKTKSLEAYHFYSKGMGVLYENPNQAVTYFEKAIQIDPNYIDPMVQAGTILVYPLGNYSDALKYLNRARSILEDNSMTQSVEYANVLGNLGQCIAWTSEKYHNNSSAQNYYLKALKILESLRMDTNDIYYKIVIDYAINKSDLELLNQNLLSMEKNGKDNSLQFVSTLNELAEYSKDVDSRLYYNKRMKDTLENNGLTYHFFYPMALLNFADYSMENYNYSDEVLKSLNKSKLYFEKLNLMNSRLVAYLYYDFGIYYIGINNKRTAKEYLEKAVKLGVKLGLEHTNDVKRFKFYLESLK